MFTLYPIDEFTDWLDGLPDPKVQKIIVARLRRISLGLLGDVEPVGEGISELRIHFGAGWRVYFTKRGKRLIVLLAGGSKSTQKNDIKRAKELANNLDLTDEDIEL